jgi:hypothetical protein
MFVSQVARVRQASENIVSRQPRIICQDFVFGLSRGKKLKNEFDRQASPANHWFTAQDLGINDDALKKRHIQAYLVGSFSRGSPWYSPLHKPVAMPDVTQYIFATLKPQQIERPVCCTTDVLRNLN